MYDLTFHSASFTGTTAHVRIWMLHFYVNTDWLEMKLSQCGNCCLVFLVIFPATGFDTCSAQSVAAASAQIHWQLLWQCIPGWLFGLLAYFQL